MYYYACQYGTHITAIPVYATWDITISKAIYVTVGFSGHNNIYIQVAYVLCYLS